MKDGLILIKDRERAEIDAAIKNWGGKIKQIKSCAEPAPKQQTTPSKKTRAEIDAGLKRRFSVLANRVKVGFEVWHRYEIIDRLLGITAGSSSKYANAGNEKVPSARLIKRLEEIVAQGKEHRIK